MTPARQIIAFAERCETACKKCGKSRAEAAKCKHPGCPMKKAAAATEMSALGPGMIQFAGGYIRTEDGVVKERGAGAHFTRHAGKYIGTALFAPIGLPVGWLIDRNRRKHNIAVTREEPLSQPWRGKGRAFAALTPGMISLSGFRISHFAFDRVRDAQGQFAPETAEGPTPQNMTRAYGHPRMTLTIRTRPKTGPLVAAGAGGMAVGAAGALLARRLIKRAP